VPRVPPAAAQEGDLRRGRRRRRDEDGEVLEIVEEPEEPPEFVGERTKDPAEVAERDEVLRRCSVIEAPAAAASWREFLADAERNAGSGNGLAPFWKVQQASAGARGAAT